ncbi:MAG TPA: hypothetical protein PKW15_03575 [Alphaproteobacteria bacterium]|nr:hypothetical protein [Alphaproteobacteria bacterium]
MHGFPKSLSVSGKQIPFVFGAAYDIEVIDNDNIPEHERDVNYVPGWHKQPERPKKTIHKEDHSAYLAISLTRWLRLTPSPDGESFAVTIMTDPRHALLNGSDDSLGFFDKLALKGEIRKFESGKRKLESGILVTDDPLQQTFENEAGCMGFKTISVARKDLPRVFTLAQRVLQQVGNIPAPDPKTHHARPEIL